MAYDVVQLAPEPKGAGDRIAALIAGEGGKTHGYIASQIFARGREAGRDLADAVHFIATLHGHHPGVIEYAGERAGSEQARVWLTEAAAAFGEERSYLTRIVVAAGPLPSTPGQAQSGAAVAVQRHALEMLARSERNGCAVGAALALMLDWRAARGVIDAAAQRFGVPLTPPMLPSQRQTLAIAAAADTPAVERAMVFGAHQLLLQHRSLWNLLEARSGARVGI